MKEDWHDAKCIEIKKKYHKFLENRYQFFSKLKLYVIFSYVLNSVTSIFEILATFWFRFRNGQCILENITYLLYEWVNFKLFQGAGSTDVGLFAPNRMNNEQCEQANLCEQREQRTVQIVRTVRTTNSSHCGNRTNNEQCQRFILSEQCEQRTVHTVWTVRTANSSLFRNRRTGRTVRTSANTVRWSLPRRKLFYFYQSFIFDSSETATSLMKLFQLSSLYGLNHALFSICQNFQNVMDCHNFVSHECHIDGCSRYLNIDFKN